MSQSQPKPTERSTKPGHPSADFPLANRVGYLVHKADMVLIEGIEDALSSIGMRVRYFFVLSALDGDQVLSQQDLSRLLNLDPTSVVSLVDEMEANQHVERRR